MHASSFSSVPCLCCVVIRSNASSLTSEDRSLEEGEGKPQSEEVGHTCLCSLKKNQDSKAKSENISVHTPSRDEAFQRIFSLPSVMFAGRLLPTPSKLHRKEAEEEEDRQEEERNETQIERERGTEEAQELSCFDMPEDPDFHRGLSRHQLSVELKLVHDMLINLMDSEVPTTAKEEQERRTHSGRGERGQTRRTELGGEEQEEEEGERKHFGSSSSSWLGPFRSRDARKRLYEEDRKKEDEKKERRRDEEEGVYQIDLNRIDNSTTRRRRVWTSPGHSDSQDKLLRTLYPPGGVKERDSYRSGRRRVTMIRRKTGEEESRSFLEERRFGSTERNLREREGYYQNYQSLMKDGWRLKKDISSLPWSANRQIKRRACTQEEERDVKTSRDKEEEEDQVRRRRLMEEKKSREESERSVALWGGKRKTRKAPGEEESAAEEQASHRPPRGGGEEKERRRKTTESSVSALYGHDRQPLRSDLRRSRSSRRSLGRSATSLLPHGWSDDLPEKRLSSSSLCHDVRCHPQEEEQEDELMRRRRLTGGGGGEEDGPGDDARERREPSRRDTRRTPFVNRRAVSMPVLPSTPNRVVSSFQHRKDTFQQKDDNDKDDGRRKDLYDVTNVRKEEQRESERSVVCRHEPDTSPRDSSGVRTPQKYTRKPTKSRLIDTSADLHHGEGQEKDDYLLFLQQDDDANEDEDEETVHFFSSCSSTATTTRESLVEEAAEEARLHANGDEIPLVRCKKKDFKGKDGNRHSVLSIVSRFHFFWPEAVLLVPYEQSILFLSFVKGRIRLVCGMMRSRGSLPRAILCRLRFRSRHQTAGVPEASPYKCPRLFPPGTCNSSPT